METTHMLKRRVGHLLRHLDERGKRLIAANEAVRLGYGGFFTKPLIAPVKAIFQSFGTVSGGTRARTDGKAISYLYLSLVPAVAVFLGRYREHFD